MEAILIDANLPSGEHNNIVSIYRPPTSNLETFNTNIENLFSDLNPKQNSIIIDGGFNICLFKNKNDIHTTNVIYLKASFSMFPHITLPTRVQNRTQTLNDNIWSNVPSGV